MGIKSLAVDTLGQLILRMNGGRGTIRLPNLDGVPSYQKNYLINGGMDYFQRRVASASTTLDTQLYLTADRWLVWHNSAAVTNGACLRDTTALGRRSRYCLRVQAQLSATSTQGMEVAQRIEAAHAKELIAAGNMALSFLFQADTVAHKIQLRLYYPTASDNFGTRTLFYTSPIKDMSAVASGINELVKFEDLPISPDMDKGLQIQISVFNYTTTGSVRNFYISEVMLNAGPKAQPFTRAGVDLCGELIKCQRYYEKNYAIDTAPGSTHDGSQYHPMPQISGTANSTGVIPFVVQKRATPTIVVYPNDGSPSGSIVTRLPAGTETERVATLQGVNERGFRIGTNTLVSETWAALGFTAESEI